MLDILLLSTLMKLEQSPLRCCKVKFTVVSIAKLLIE